MQRIIIRKIQFIIVVFLLFVHLSGQVVHAFQFSFLHSTINRHYSIATFKSFFEYNRRRWHTNLSNKVFWQRKQKQNGNVTHSLSITKYQGMVSNAEAVNIKLYPVALFKYVKDSDNNIQTVGYQFVLSKDSQDCNNLRNAFYAYKNTSYMQDSYFETFQAFIANYGINMVAASNFDSGILIKNYCPDHFESQKDSRGIQIRVFSNNYGYSPLPNHKVVYRSFVILHIPTVYPSFQEYIIHNEKLAHKETQPVVWDERLKREREQYPLNRPNRYRYYIIYISHINNVFTHNDSYDVLLYSGPFISTIEPQKMAEILQQWNKHGMPKIPQNKK